MLSRAAKALGIQRLPWQRSICLAAAVSAGLVVAAIAGMLALPGSAAADSSPAGLAPRASVVYAEAQVDPGDEREQWLRDILRKFPGGANPERALARLIDDGLRGAGLPLRFSVGIKPWLGDTVGGFVTVSGDGEPSGALLLATTSRARARAAIAKVARKRGIRRSYRGITYRVVASDIAAAVVERFAVIGDRRGVRQAIDAARGRSLLGSRAYRSAIKTLPQGRLASFYVDARRSLSASVDAARLSRRERRLARRALGRLTRRPVIGAVSVEPRAVVFDATLSRSLSSLVSPLLGGGTPLLATLPSDSWAASAVPAAGRVLRRVIDVIAASSGSDRGQTNRLFKRTTRLDLDRDVLSWIGDLGTFIRGTGSAVGGGVVIESLDAATSASTLKRLVVLLRKRFNVSVATATLPNGGRDYSLTTPFLAHPFHAAQKDGRVVLVYGDNAARLALAGVPKLSDTPRYQEAAAALVGGYAPSNYLSFGPLAAALRTLGLTDRGDVKLMRYVGRLDYLIAGTKAQGTTAQHHAKLVLK